MSCVLHVTVPQRERFYTAPLSFPRPTWSPSASSNTSHFFQGHAKSVLISSFDHIFDGSCSLEITPYSKFDIHPPGDAKKPGIYPHSMLPTVPELHKRPSKHQQRRLHRNQNCCNLLASHLTRSKLFSLPASKESYSVLS
jgi:hypothetical protein